MGARGGKAPAAMLHGNEKTENPKPQTRGTRQEARGTRSMPQKSAMANYSKTTVQSGLEKVRALERQHV